MTEIKKPKKKKLSGWQTSAELHRCGYNDAIDDYDAYLAELLEPMKKIYKNYSDGRTRISYQYIDKVWIEIQQLAERMGW